MLPVLTHSHDRLALKLYRDLPKDVRKGLDRSTDRALRQAVAVLGGPNLPDDMVLLLLGNGGAKASIMARELKRYAGATALKSFPFFAASGWDVARSMAGWDPTRGAAGGRAARHSGFGDGGGQGSNQGVTGAMSIRRQPWTLFGQTTLTAAPTPFTAGNGAGSPIDSSGATYVNGTGYDFIVTHLTMSQNQAPLILAPSYRIQISPQYGLPWTGGSRRLDANAMLSYVSGMSPVSSTLNAQLCTWDFHGASFVLSPSQSLFAQATNLNQTEGIQVTVLLYGTKANDLGSTRLFADTLYLTAGQTSAAFNTANYQNDGDFDCELGELHISSGVGNWGFTQPTAPSVFVRPADQREFMSQIAIAANLNNTMGCTGSFLRLRQPQRLPTGSVINMSIEDTTGLTGQIANVGFLGYLEIPSNS